MAKKVIAIHDLSGFGRCSLTTIISVLSSMKIQTCPIPVSTLSSHTALDNYYISDNTQILQASINQWKNFEITFSAIYSGFVSNSNQIFGISDAIDIIKPDIILIDPVMGDNGRVYKTYTQEICENMKKLTKKADIITPNITELFILLDMPLDSKIKDEAEIINLVRKLDTKLVLTGIEIHKNKIGICVFDGNSAKFYYKEHINSYYPGTGDLFASVLLGYLLNNVDLYESAVLAANFVFDCIKYTDSLAVNPLFGVEFEELLGNLKT